MQAHLNHEVEGQAFARRSCRKVDRFLRLLRIPVAAVELLVGSLRRQELVALPCRHGELVEFVCDTRERHHALGAELADSAANECAQRKPARARLHEARAVRCVLDGVGEDERLLLPVIKLRHAKEVGQCHR